MFRRTAFVLFERPFTVGRSTHMLVSEASPRPGIPIESEHHQTHWRQNGSSIFSRPVHRRGLRRPVQIRQGAARGNFFVSFHIAGQATSTAAAHAQGECRRAMSLRRSRRQSCRDGLPWVQKRHHLHGRQGHVVPNWTPIPAAGNYGSFRGVALWPPDAESTRPGTTPGFRGNWPGTHPMPVQP
jgi:hypothetical protein